IGDDRNREAVFDFAYGVVFGVALVEVAAGAAMQSQSGDADILGQAGNTNSIARLRIPAGAGLECNRNLVGSTCLDNVFKDFNDAWLVTQEGGARGHVTDFFGRATHIDINDASTFADIEYSGFGHHFRV